MKARSFKNGAEKLTVSRDQETWLTPRYILDALGSFDLDPCAAPSPRPWPTASRHYELPKDGLTAEWKGRVWLNPPYGSGLLAWTRRLADHPGGGTLLVFARLETAFWQRAIFPKASAVLFLKGRLRFCGRDGKPAGGAGAPSALCAFGDRDAQILRTCRLRGWLFEGSPRPVGVTSIMDFSGARSRRRKGTLPRLPVS